MKWSKILIGNDGTNYYFYSNGSGELSIRLSTCSACGKYPLWLQDKMLVPISSNIPMPNEDTPEEVKEIYLEAREVFPYSAKAAAALLR